MHTWKPATLHLLTSALGILVNVVKERYFILRLDYVGIALLIVGSFVPWIFYSFYCHFEPKLIYIILICVLGAAVVVVSLWDRFSAPKYRPLRAGIFLGLALSGKI